jgi:hypothetical protein
MNTYANELDTWHSRDLPFLRELVHRLDAEPTRRPTGAQIANALGMDRDDALRAVASLKRGELVITAPGPTRWGAGALGTGLDVTAEGLRESGAWPTPETALDRMSAALEAIAEHTDDEDTRSRARRLLDGLTGAGKTLGVSVAAAAISGQLPQ